jgi:hypothetical protein
LKSDEFATITNGERVTVALCFKSAPDKCQNTTTFNNWLRLVDDFYLQAQDAPRQIEFIVDGDAAPTQPCLVGRWSKWNSVWINSNSPSDAFYSNAEENDYYRFQVLNNPESQGNWSWMASADVNYGKFSNGSYPYQLWEVSLRAETFVRSAFIFLCALGHIFCGSPSFSRFFRSAYEPSTSKFFILSQV